MARVTVEDCLKVVNNRFELVLIAAKRARQLMRGSVDSKVPWDNDKSTVVALREIAAGYSDFTEVVEPEVVAKPVLEVAILEDDEGDIELDLTEAVEVEAPIKANDNDETEVE